MKSCRLLEIEHLTAHTFLVRVERPDIPIKAGQYFSVGLSGHGINREYSLYSAADASYLEFLIRSVENGLVSSMLQQAKFGDFIEINGPFGEFCLKEPIDTENHYLLVATGTGIAPFHSFISTYPGLSCTILHGVRAEEECYHLKDYGAVNYKACVSQPTNGRLGRRVTNYLENHATPSDAVIYLCGNSKMIIDAFQILCDQKISSDQIATEVFF